MNYLLTEMKKCNGRLGKKTDNADNRRTLCAAASVVPVVVCPCALPPSLCAPQLGASSLPPPACRAEAQEESTQIRQDTMRLIKDFRSSGATQAQQDKLVRDFQSVMKKVVDATKETGKYNVVQLPPPRSPASLLADTWHARRDPHAEAP
jgi:hypothetical protein